MKFRIAFVFSLLFSTFAFAYPELTRFQYNTCSACHVAPSGGGLLTPYGRNLSHEILSTWGTEKEAGVMHGLINQEELNDWLLIGGDIRAVQTHTENSVRTTGRFIKMQADIAVGIVKETWAIVSQFGQLSKGTGQNRDGDGWSPEPTNYYAMWKPKDEITLRVGRFVPQYGIYMSDHFAFVRSGLMLGLNSNRPVLEGEYLGEQWSAVLSLAGGSDIQSTENVVTVQGQYLLGERSKIAANIWQGNGSGLDHQMYGFWMLLGFSPQLFWSNEFDWQNTTVNGSGTHSFFTYHKLGYTLMKGLDALLIGEFAKNDLNDPSTETRRIGVGAQFFPRPHFEVSGAWTKQKSLAVNSEDDYAWMLLHYYL